MEEFPCPLLPKKRGFQANGFRMKKDWLRAPPNGESNFHEVEGGWEQMTSQGKGSHFERETFRGTGA